MMGKMSGYIKIGTRESGGKKESKTEKIQILILDKKIIKFRKDIHEKKN